MNFEYRKPFILVLLFKFLLSVFLIFVPNRNQRKKLRAKLKNYIKFNFIDTLSTIVVFSQYKFLDQYKNFVTDLYMGSSHCLYGIKFDDNDITRINLSASSLDFYYINRLHSFLCKQCIVLKKVVIIFSAFNSGFIMQKSKVSLDPAPAFYKEILNIPRCTEGNILDSHCLVEKEIREFSEIHGDGIGPNYFNYITNLRNSIENYNLTIRKELGDDKYWKQELERTSKHSKFAINDSAMKYFLSLIKSAHDYNQKVYVIVPPHTGTLKILIMIKRLLFILKTIFPIILTCKF